MARRKELLIVDSLAKRYSVLPHEVAGLDLGTFEFDYKVALAGADEERMRRERTGS